MGREKFTPDISPEKPRSQEELSVLNKIDRLLMYRYIQEKGIAPDDDLNPHLIKWIETYGDKVEKLFEALIKEEPELLENWSEHADSVTERIVSVIEPEIYPEEFEQRKAA